MRKFESGEKPGGYGALTVKLEFGFDTQGSSCSCDDFARAFGFLEVIENDHCNHEVWSRSACQLETGITTFINQD